MALRQESASGVLARLRMNTSDRSLEAISENLVRAAAVPGRHAGCGIPRGGGRLRQWVGAQARTASDQPARCNRNVAVDSIVFDPEVSEICQPTEIGDWAGQLIASDVE